MTKLFYSLFIIATLFCGYEQKSLNIDQSQDHPKDWAFKSFTKVDSINPILKPTTNLSFECPITKEQRNWEERKEEKYKNHWSKSGAIVVELVGNKNIAKKSNGKYWMYFGDTNLFLASSDDLINWNICENEENHKMIAVL